MNKKGFIVISALSLVLGAAVAVGAQAPKAMAVSAAGNMRIYVDTEEFYSGLGANLKYWYDGAGSDKTSSGSISGSNIITADRNHLSRNIYYLETAASYSGLYIKNGAGSDQWHPENAAIVQGAVFQPSSWGNPGSFNTYHMYKVHINDDGNETDEYFVTEWNAYAAPTPAGKAGYEFTGWYLDSGYVNEFTGVAIGAATGDFNLYAHYEAAPAYEDYTYYVSDPRGFLGNTVYGYAFVNSTKEQYHAWPGDSLSGSNHVFSFTVSNKYDSIIFNNGTHVDESENKQTIDITDARTHNGKYYLIEYIDGSGKCVGEWSNSASGEYVATVDGTDYPMVVNTNLVSTSDYEFMTSATVSMSADDVVSFKNGASAISSANVDITNGANAYKDSGTIYVHNACTEKVYFKHVSNVANWQLYIGSYAESYRISNVPVTYDDEFPGDATYDYQYKSASVSWSAAQVITMTETGHAITIAAETGDNNVYDDSGTIKVHNACTQVIYAKHRISDGIFVIWLGGRTHTRAIKIGANTIPLTLYQEQGQPDQYRATGVSLTAGQSIEYYYDGAVTSFTPKLVGNNNMTSDKKVLATTTGDIYLSLSDELWIGGFDVGGFHLLVNNTTYVRMTQNAHNPSEYYSDAVTYHIGDTVKIINCSFADQLPVVFNPKGGINPASLPSGCFAMVDGVATAQINKTLVTYIQLESENDKLYFNESEPYIRDAIEFVNDLSGELTTACSLGSESAKIAAISSAWAEAASAFTSSLSEDSQDEIKKGNASTVNEIKAFEGRYIFFMSHYGVSAELDDFLGWEIAGSVAPYNPLFGNADNTTIIMVIAIVGLVGASAVAGFFYVRRRRQHK